MQGGQLMVRFSSVQIPLDQLSLTNPLVQAATPIFTVSYSLQPDVAMNVPLNVPLNPPPGSQLIVMTMDGWTVNQNQVIWLDQIPPHRAGAAARAFHPSRWPGRHSFLAC